MNILICLSLFLRLPPAHKSRTCIQLITRFLFLLIIVHEPLEGSLWFRQRGYCGNCGFIKKNRQKNIFSVNGRYFVGEVWTNLEPLGESVHLRGHSYFRVFITHWLIRNNLTFLSWPTTFLKNILEGLTSKWFIPLLPIITLMALFSNFVVCENDFSVSRTIMSVRLCHFYDDHLYLCMYVHTYILLWSDF